MDISMAHLFTFTSYFTTTTNGSEISTFGFFVTKCNTYFLISEVPVITTLLYSRYIVCIPSSCVYYELVVSCFKMDLFFDNKHYKNIKVSKRIYEHLAFLFLFSFKILL